MNFVSPIKIKFFDHPLRPKLKRFFSSLFSPTNSSFIFISDTITQLIYLKKRFFLFSSFSKLSSYQKLWSPENYNGSAMPMVLCPAKRSSANTTPAVKKNIIKNCHTLTSVKYENPPHLHEALCECACVCLRP